MYTRECKEEARAAKRCRKNGDGRFQHPDLLAKLRKTKAQEEIKEAVRELQWRGEIKPEPEPTAEEKADLEVQKLAAFEKCASCTTCEWSRQGSKSCRGCLGQFCRTHRLNKTAL